MPDTNMVKTGYPAQDKELDDIFAKLGEESRKFEQSKNQETQKETNSDSSVVNQEQETQEASKEQQTTATSEEDVSSEEQTNEVRPEEGKAQGSEDNSQEEDFDLSKWFEDSEESPATVQKEEKTETVEQESKPVVEANKDYEDLPPKLREAIELAKKGQDYESIFANDQPVLNHRMFDDETLLRHKYADAFTDANGNLDEAQLGEYLDSLSDIAKKVEAKQTRKELEAYEKAEQARKTDKMEREREKAQNELLAAVSNMKEYKGFKVTPDMQQNLFQEISNGKAMKEMFYKADGSYDMKKMAEVYFVYKNFDKIKSFLVNRISNKVRKEDFEKISNAQVNSRQTHTEVNNMNKGETLTPLQAWVKDLELQSQKK